LNSVTAGFRVSAWVVVASLLLVSPAAAQAKFRTTYTVKARDAAGIVLQGQVVNETGRDAFDVWITAEALNPSHKVLSTGITFVSSAIARGASAPYEAKIPAAEGVETFRVSVTSFRAGSAPAQPGREVQSP
jgi:hypothetical protein